MKDVVEGFLLLHYCHTPLNVVTTIVDLEFDPNKRDATFEARGLDMAEAGKVIEGDSLTFEDDRYDYGEVRYITIGYLAERMVVIVWTERGDAARVISMRNANEREQRKYRPHL